MEAEEEWNKDQSALKSLDKKVLRRQNGGIGKASVQLLSSHQAAATVY